MDAYATLQDENAENTSLVESSEHGNLHRSEATKDDENSFARVQIMTTGPQQFEQEQQEDSSIFMMQLKGLKPLESDIKKKGTSSLYQYKIATA